MVKVGITGNMGSGKSLVCRLFHEFFSWPVFDADTEAKLAMTHDQAVKAAIINHFGPESYWADGSLNRQHLAQAFKQPEKLELLNSIVHPASIHRYINWLDLHQSDAVTLKEAALLLEATDWRSLDAIIVVTAPEDVRMSRVLTRDPQRTQDQVRAIFSKQWPEADKVKHATFVVDNSGTKPLLPQIAQIGQAILTKSVTSS